ncbi:cupin domain-containing protein [Paraburkholderia solisilvae]|uniref:Cupin type-2 domain-containing protein n=1 Tax=Paraburkholderia solisilvae TaxID=624376 RepID=A0A6J5E1V9_9BURK|nr:cupin domain-containing protein [Paraburkholderia solisilvae]CAB3759072.1 hypothetical protein LMG29739_03099 [Paraburkholderia solisilvae]
MDNLELNTHDDFTWLQTRPGERCTILIPAAKTAGAYSVVEIVSTPGDSTPTHVHETADEHYVILEGTMRIKYGDKVFDAHAGDSLTLKRNVPHAWGNPGKTPLRMLATTTPGGAEEVLIELDAGRFPDAVALADRLQIRLVDEKPFLP